MVRQAEACEPVQKKQGTASFEYWNISEYLQRQGRGLRIYEYKKEINKTKTAVYDFAFLLIYTHLFSSSFYLHTQ